MDSGASRSYTNDETSFVAGSLIPYHGSVTIGNGQSLNIAGTGNVNIIVAIENTIKQVTLKNVLLIPSLSFKLLSLGVATERGCSYIGTNDGINVYKGDSNRLTLQGKRVQASGMVVLVQSIDDPSELLTAQGFLDSLPSSNDTCLISAVTRSTPKPGSLYYWHLVLNHKRPEEIKAMARNNAVSGMKITDDHWPGCTSCNLCKLSRTAQPNTSDLHSHQSYHYDTIVGDVIGKISIPTLNEEAYASLFMDLRTRYISVQLHKSCTSSDILSHLSKFIALIERQPDLPNHTSSGSRKIRCVRTDMASYFTSDLFSSPLAEKGIIQQFSAHCFPEKNGHAERLNRTLIEATRTVMHQGHLVFPLWGEVLRSVTQVYNMSSHSALENRRTPYEALFGEIPAVNLLRPIGTTCYYKLENTPKFSPKGQTGQLLGYHPFSKAYRIWDTSENKIAVSYNVKFDNNEWKSEHINPSLTTNITNIPKDSMSVNPPDLTTVSTPPTTFNSTPTTSPTPSSPQTTVDDTTVSTPTPTPEPEPQIPVVSENETLTFAAPNIQVRQSIPRAAKDKCINTLIENRKALSAVLSESIPSAEGDNNYSNLFDNCLKFISNQSDDIETLFDNTRYNFSVEDITQALSGKVLESALLISQDMCSSDSPTLSQAMQGPEADKWTSAIKKEFDTLWNTGTFETVHRKDVPAHQKVISAKIHLRLKHDPVRDLTQHKARFVVRGFSQQEGIDYNDIYSPVASFKSILALLTIGAHLDYEIHQMDFDAAFLNASIKEEVYVAPVGSLDPRLPANHVYRLRKTLYGLKQSPHC